MLKNKDNLTLLLALAIPIVFILILMGYLYISPLIFKPKTNFIYYFDQNHSNNNVYSYSVVNGKIDTKVIYNYYDSYSQTNQTMKKPDPIFPDIYLYDVKTNESKIITLDEAKQYSYIKNDFSPDGFEVIDGSSSGGGLFYSGSSRYDDFFLRKNGYTKKINISADNNNNSYYNFELIGWIKN